MEQERQALLNGVLEAAVDAIIVIDSQGTILETNPATETLFGYGRSEVIGRNVNILMPSPYHEEHDGYLERYRDTHERRIIGIGREVLAQRKGGSTFPIHLAVSEIEFGDRRLFAGIIRDISDVVRAKGRAEGIGRIVEDSLNEVFIFDAGTWKFLEANRIARENLGYSMSELSALTPVDIMPEYDSTQFTDLVAPLVRGEVETVQLDTLHRRRDGTHYDVETHLQLTELDGRRCFVAIILDTTQRNEAARQLQQQQQAIQKELERRVAERTDQLKKAQNDLVEKEKLATLGQVSGGIAHEIRNPLNALKTSAYYLLHAKNVDPSKVREHLERIDRQVTMIDNVITALSDVARLPEPNVEPCRIDNVIKEVLGNVGIRDQITVANEIPHDLPDVLVDTNQIPMVFRNLIRNARDAMPDGGQITLSAEVSDPYVTVHVTDTGVGIHPDDLDRVAEPLFSTKPRGMGLGLAISRVILEKNRGSMSVQSDLGKGTTFSIDLPTRHPHATATLQDA